MARCEKKKKIFTAAIVALSRGPGFGLLGGQHVLFGKGLVLSLG